MPAADGGGGPGGGGGGGDGGFDVAGLGPVIVVVACCCCGGGGVGWFVGFLFSCWWGGYLSSRECNLSRWLASLRILRTKVRLQYLVDEVEVLIRRGRCRCFCQCQRTRSVRGI